MGNADCPTSLMLLFLPDPFPLYLRLDAQGSGRDRAAPAPSVVLVVESTPQSQDSLTTLLREAQLTVHTLADASRLEATLLTLQPDLVVLAPDAASAAGWEALTTLRKLRAGSEVPVIVVGGEATDELRALAAGASDFVPRPVVNATFLLRVRNQIATQRMRRKLSLLADTDPLTGLANRRRFDDALQHELSRLRRSNAPLSLLMIDVDHFKAFNDTYGHLCGDQCLRHVGTVVSEILGRSPDVAARYGGEEFCGILPETDFHGALTVAERVRTQVAMLHINHAVSETARHVTVSIGLATVNCAEVESPFEVVRRADECLYEAKRAGRNCVMPQPVVLSRQPVAR